MKNWIGRIFFSKPWQVRAERKFFLHNFLVLIITFLLSTVEFSASGQSIHPEENLPSISLADTPWPMHQHDPQHTARSPFLIPQTKPELLAAIPLCDTNLCRVEGYSTTFLPGGDLLIVLNGYTFRFDPVKREIVWVSQYLRYSGKPLIANDGSFYVGFMDVFSKVWQHNEIAWLAILNSNLVFSSGANIGTDGNLYVVRDALWSFRPDGVLRWVYFYTSYAHDSPAIVKSGIKSPQNRVPKCPLFRKPKVQCNSLTFLGDRFQLVDSSLTRTSMIQSMRLQTEDRAPVETDSSAVPSPVTGQRLTQLCSFASALSLVKKCDKLNADLPERISGAMGQTPPVLHSMAGVLTSQRGVSP